MNKNASFLPLCAFHFVRPNSFSFFVFVWKSLLRNTHIYDQMFLFKKIKRGPEDEVEVYSILQATLDRIITSLL